MSMTFNDFVQFELPLRPFASSDGTTGQVLARSGNANRPRELIWVDLPGLPVEMALVAGESISGHRAVMVGADGKLHYADPADAQACIGISKHAALTDGPILVATRDYLTEMTWAWLPGKPIYFLAGGVLTQTAPTDTAFTPIALAITPTTILIDRQPPIFL